MSWCADDMAARDALEREPTGKNADECEREDYCLLLFLPLSFPSFFPSFSSALLPLFSGKLVMQLAPGWRHRFYLEKSGIPISLSLSPLVSWSRDQVLLSECLCSVSFEPADRRDRYRGTPPRTNSGKPRILLHAKLQCSQLCLAERYFLSDLFPFCYF